MLDQSFTSKNFLEIFDNENRKGKHIEKRFKIDFAESLEDLKELKNINNSIRATKNSNIRSILYQKRKAYKKERDKKILSTLELASKNIAKSKTPINICLGEIHGKQSYFLEESLENFFISKKIQENISRTYNIKPSSRFSILTEVVTLLKNKFPKYVIRTDIKSFYESIPQKLILDKINRDNLLSITTKKFITEVLDGYNILTGQETSINPLGVPRGIGFSAYLAELYMRKIDVKIKNLKDVVYYGRYVDDMIIIFTPDNKFTDASKLKQYLGEVKKIVEEEDLSLSPVTEKTKEYNLLNGISNLKVKKIEFLGYNISSVKEANKEYELSIGLSENKEKKYKEKIKKAFDAFKKKKDINSKKAFNLLNSRLMFLTNNTKLRNNKNKVYVGVYYSNIFLNNMSELNTINNYTIWHINRTGLSVSQKLELKKNNFVDGFKSKRFILFPLKNRVYKNKNSRPTDYKNMNNKGVVQFGLTEINSIWKHKL